MKLPKIKKHTVFVGSLSLFLWDKSLEQWKKRYNLLWIRLLETIADLELWHNNISNRFILLVIHVNVFTIIFTVYTYFDMALYCTWISLFGFAVSGNLTRRLSVEGASGSQSSGTNNTRQSQPADKLPKIGEHTLTEHRYNPKYSNPTAEVRKSANSAKGSELKKSNSAKQMYIATMGDSPDNSSGFVKSEERPFRLPPIRDGGSQIPGNSGILCSRQLVGNDLDDGDGSLAWEVDVSDMLPHGRSGKKPGLF